MGNFLKRYIWLILGLLLFGWVLRGVEFRATWEILSNLRLWQIAVLIVVNIGVLLTLYMRWWIILRGMGHHIPLNNIARYTLAGFAVSYLTPGPQFGGEPLQILFLTRRHQIRLEEATASVAVEKLLGLITDLFFLSIGLIFLLQTELLPQQNQLSAVALLLIAITLFVALFGSWYRGTHPLTSLLTRILHILPSSIKGEGVVEGLNDTEGEMIQLCQARTGYLALSILFSAASWLLFASEYLLTARYLGLELTPLLAVLLITAFRIAFLVPVPGGFGTIEASQIAVLRAFGIPNAVEIGLGLSVIIRLRDLILTLLGLVYAGQLPESRPARDKK